MPTISNKGEGGNRLYADNPIIPQLWLDQRNVRPETVRHHLNRYRLAAEYVRVGSMTIDVCCGTGYGTDMLRAAGAVNAVGIDMSSRAIAVARRAYPKCNFVLGDAHF
jgi:ubiquinone/menaquinone biosynthesis C-methylase UbiE